MQGLLMDYHRYQVISLMKGKSPNQSGRGNQGAGGTAGGSCDNSPALR